MPEALLVDDEALARQQLREALASEPNINIIGEASNGLEAIEMIARLKPDLVFLDIEMPGLNGFEVINSLKQCPHIIFVTAYDQYAIRAFEVNAVDYLLKPVTAGRLHKSLARIREALAGDSEFESAALQQLVTKLNKMSHKHASRLAAYRGNHIVLVNISDILYAKVEDKLVFVYTKGGRLLVNRSLSDLEEILSAEGFFRINRSTIINLECLVEIIPWFSGTCKLKLSTQEEMTVSRERVRHLKENVGLLRTNEIL
jgi:two-component system LytT family response regulator/two-component system response regulator LytT